MPKDKNGGGSDAGPIKPTADDPGDSGRGSASPMPAKPSDEKISEIDDHAQADDERTARVVFENATILIGNQINNSAIGTDAQAVSGSGGSGNDSGSSGGNGAGSHHPKKKRLGVKQLGTWFRERSIQEQAFTLSMLFFSGNSPNFINGATKHLLQILGVESDKLNVRSSIFESVVPVDILFKDKLIKTIPTSFNSEAGKLQFNGLVFQNEQIHAGLQELVIKNYDFVSLHPALLRWLVSIIKFSEDSFRDTGTSIPDVARVQAAMGVGVLARADFSEMLSSLIRPWAGSEDPAERLMVGWMLLGYFERSNQHAYWTSTTSLLKHWSTLDNYYFRWTAIASTTRLGLIVSPEDDSSLVLALSIFKEVCKSGKASPFRGAFRRVVIKSFRFLFSLSPLHARALCIELASWLRDEEDLPLHDVAAELFIEGVNLGIAPEDGESDSKGVSIWEICETESYVLTDAVFELVHQALCQQRGSSVDYAIRQLSKSIQEYMEQDATSNRALKGLLGQLRRDKSTAGYVRLIVGDHKELLEQ